MKHHLVALKDRIIRRLMAHPECLNMSEFSRISALFVPTFCLAGLILDESGVGMQHGGDGRAMGLLACEAQPSPSWIRYETSLSKEIVAPENVVIPAKARELWAIEHGAAAAKILPFYARDWELETPQLGQITPERLIQLLQTINIVATTVAIAA